jgi:hypothetical protein
MRNMVKWIRRAGGHVDSVTKNMMTAADAVAGNLFVKTIKRNIFDRNDHFTHPHLTA